MSDRVASPARPAFFNSEPFNDEPINNARRRAERAITEDAFFDVRGARVPKSTLGSAFDEFGDDVRSSINRIRSAKKSTNFSSDVDFDDAVDSLKRRTRVDYDSGADAASSSIKKSSFKVQFIIIKINSNI